MRGLFKKDTAPLNIIAGGEKREARVITTVKLHKNQYVCEYRTHKVHDNEVALEQALREYRINEERAHVLTAMMCSGKQLHFDVTRCQYQFGRYLNTARYLQLDKKKFYNIVTMTICLLCQCDNIMIITAVFTSDSVCIYIQLCLHLSRAHIIFQLCIPEYLTISCLLL